MADFGEGKMDNALKFDKVAALPHDQFNRVPRRPGRAARDPLVGPPQGRPQVPEAGRADQEVSPSARPGTRSRSTRRSSAPSSSPTTRPTEHEDEAQGQGQAKKKFTEHPAWESDFYNDEVIRIVADYLTLDPNVLLVKPIRATADRGRITQ